MTNLPHWCSHLVYHAREVSSSLFLFIQIRCYLRNFAVTQCQQEHRESVYLLVDIQSNSKHLVLRKLIQELTSKTMICNKAPCQEFSRSFDCSIHFRRYGLTKSPTKIISIWELSSAKTVLLHLEWIYFIQYYGFNIIIQSIYESSYKNLTVQRWVIIFY